MKKDYPFLICSGLLLLSLTFTGESKSSAQGVCSNFDFAYGDFFNWTGKVGSYKNMPPYYIWSTVGIPASLLLPGAPSTTSCKGSSPSPKRFSLFSQNAFPILPENLRPKDPNTGNNLYFVPQDSVRDTERENLFRNNSIPDTIITRDTIIELQIKDTILSDTIFRCFDTIITERETSIVKKDTIYSNDTILKYKDTILYRYKFLTSARLGNPCTGAEAEALCFNYQPGPESNLLTLNYAIVLENPSGHSVTETPAFQIHVKCDGIVTEILKCAELDINANRRQAGDTAYHTYNASYGPVVYRSWTKVGIDLRLYQGNNIEIELDIGDCSPTAHFGYAYFAGTCNKMELKNIGYYGTSVNSDTVAIITAPEGYTYWWTNEYNEILNKFDPVRNCYDTLSNILSLKDSDFGELSTIKIFCQLTSLVTGINGRKCVARLEANVDNNRPFPKFEMERDTCDKNRKVYFTSTSIARASALDTNSVRWDFGDGISSRKMNPMHIYENPGIYIVKYAISSEIGIRAFTTDTIIIDTLPVAKIDSNKNNSYGVSKICPGDSIKLACTSQRENGRDTCRWIVNDTVIYGKTYSGVINDTTCIQLIVADTKTGCKDSSFHTVNVIPRPEITFTGDSIICMGNTTTLTAYSDYGIRYWWSEGTQGASITKTPMSDTSFTVYSENEVPNCISNKTVNISMTIPKLESTKLTICPGETVVLTASEAFAYQWTPTPADTNLSEADLLQPQLIVSPSQTTTYSVTGKGQNGCSADPLSRTVKVYPYPTARFEYTPNYIDSENPVVAFRDRSDNAYTILWDFGDGATTEQRNPSHKYTDLSKDSMRVFIKVLNELGCSDSTFKYLPIGIFAVWSSNSFTPEASTNNIFKFYSKNTLSYFSLVIYDRWGQQVFQSNNINLGWDGTYKGKKCPTGSYVWIMSYKRPESNRTYQEKGNVNLIR